MNSIASFLPFFEPAVDWDDHPNDPYGRSTRILPHHRQLHTFVPLPSSSSIPTLSSHGGLPTHMVLNPELQLRPLSIRRETNTIEDHRSTGKPVRMESPLSARVGAPISGPPANPVVRAPQVSPHTTEPTRPKAKESPTEDARPKKKQRANRHNHFLDYSHHSPNLGDIPPEGFNSDSSDDDTCRRHFPSNPRPISPPPESKCISE